jgi:hypothetical protein
VTFSTPNEIIEGKLSKFLGKSGLNIENTDGLATLRKAFRR